MMNPHVCKWALTDGFAALDAASQEKGRRRFGRIRNANGNKQHVTHTFHISATNIHTSYCPLWYGGEIGIWHSCTYKPHSNLMDMTPTTTREKKKKKKKSYEQWPTHILHIQYYTFRSHRKSRNCCIAYYTSTCSIHYRSHLYYIAAKAGKTEGGGERRHRERKKNTYKECEDDNGIFGAHRRRDLDSEYELQIPKKAIFFAFICVAFTRQSPTNYMCFTSPNVLLYTVDIVFHRIMW